MYHKLKSIKQQRGISLLMMVMFVVLISLVSAALVKLTSTANVTIGNEVINTRSFFAAETGAQNAMALLFPLNGTLVTTCSTVNNALNSPAITLTANGLGSCSVSVICNGPSNINGRYYYEIESTGQCGSGQSVAVRTIRISARTL
ncbi:MAG: pilus assembly PilX N-terminal domain-containing protein [Thiohalomonadales bacterium]